MITDNIVFILGAGASQPFGFPTGQQLVTEIYEALEYTKETEWVPEPPSQKIHFSYNAGGIEREIDDDTRSHNQLVQMLLDSGFKKNFIEQFRQSLVQSQLNSIDAFLERRTEFIPIGKMAIAYVLLKYENHEEVMSQNSDWYRYIWNRLNTSFLEFEKNKLSIITFNYDRSFEYYLFNAFKATYGKEDSECISKLRTINIIHLHGKLGELPWEDGIQTKFGQEIKDKEKLKEVSESIKIIHEDIGNNVEFQQAYNLMNSANKIFFLGFGFSDTNIKRLNLGNLKNKLMSASTFGMTRTEVERLTNITGGKINFSIYTHFKCLEFLREQLIE